MTQKACLGFSFKGGLNILYYVKALFFNGDTLVLDSDYKKPDTSECIVRVDLAGICGTDLEILRGYMSYNGVLGHEFVGTVVNGPTNLIGKRVVGEINVGCKHCESCKNGLQRHCPNRTVLGILNRDGAFAQFLSLPEENLHIIPDTVSLQQAVFVEPLAAAFEILEQVNIKPEWKIAIVGDGRLAQLISRVMKLKSKNIFCFGKHEDKLKKLQTLDISTSSEITTSDEKCFDLVIEATGRESGFLDSLKLVKPRGNVILKSTIASKNKLDLSPAVVHEITFIGSRCGPFKPAIDALATGVIQTDDLIDSEYTIDNYDKAFKRASEPDSLKVLLRPNQ